MVDVLGVLCVDHEDLHLIVKKSATETNINSRLNLVTSQHPYLDLRILDMLYDLLYFFLEFVFNRS